MSERLFIRLGKNINATCAWLIWSEQEQEIIASGELANAHELSTLTARATNRLVEVLVPSSAITLTQVNLPIKGQRQAIKALPFILEEGLAQNVDELHFVVGSIVGEEVNVAIVSHEQMQDWLTWLSDADLKAVKLVPDCLALELDGSDWAFMEIDGQILLRTSEGTGVSLPSPWLQPMLPKLLAQHETTPEIACYTTFPALEDLEIDCRAMQLDLPLLVLARGAKKAAINLLSGIYTPKREYNKQLLLWRKTAILAGIVMLLILVNKGLNIYQLQNQAEQAKAESEAIYRQVVPGKSRIVNLRSQIGSQLRALSGGGGGSEFFLMIEDLASVFNENKALKPTSLRFDAGRGEIRMQISAKTYAQVEKFKAHANTKFELEGGAMNRTEDAVTSTLTLRSK